MKRQNIDRSAYARSFMVAMPLVFAVLTDSIVPCNALAGLSPSNAQQSSLFSFESEPELTTNTSRRNALRWIALGGAVTGWIAGSPKTWADTDIDNYLKTGMVAQPMGVSGQGGKSRPETGVVLRDGSEISRDSRTGNVFSELLVKSTQGGDRMAVVTSFSSPWPVATGDLFGIECRDSATGDGAYVAVSSPIDNGKSLSDLNDSFFTKTIFSKTGRFSFYGQPTDIKVKKSSSVTTDGVDYRLIEVAFSTLSQSTQTEIPRRAQVVATIPPGSSQAVMLIGSSSYTRWKKGAEKSIASTIDTFRAIPAPESSMALRSKTKSS